MRNPSVIAFKQAIKATYRQRLGAVLVRGNKVLEVGHNSLRHQGAIRTTHYAGSLHAEMDVISKMIRSGRSKEIEGSTLHIVRVRKDGSYGLALPCKDCIRVLLALKVKNVYYSNDDQKFSEVRL